MIPKIDSRIIKLLNKFEVKNSQGKVFEWKEHAFLLQPLADFHPRQAVRKCSQIGWSEMTILKTFYMAQYLGLNILYTLPTDTFLKDFVPPKVDEIIKNNPRLYGGITGGIYQKKIVTNEGNRFIFFQGAHNSESSSNQETTSKGVSITVDIKIHDEASKSDAFVLNQMKSRTNNSRYKGEWLFDNPVYPGMGADADYGRSDQMHWMIQCSHCNYWQYLDWYRLDKHTFEKGSFHTWINPDKKIIECGNCRKKISDNDRLAGKWIPKYPSRDKIRGYWMNQLNYVLHTVDSLLDVEEDPKTTQSYFNNFVLGKPYVGSDVKLDKSTIIENMSSDVNPLIHNAMGIDQGNTKWYVIGNQFGIFKIGHTESWEELEFLFNKYKCVAVCDALPYQGDPKRMAAKYPGRFYRAFYKPMADQAEVARFSPSGKMGMQKDIVLIRRNESFDELFDKIINTQLPIQAPMEEAQGDFIRHLTSLVRIVETDKDGNQRFDWVNTDQDHLAHALNYWKTAMVKAKSASAIPIKTPKQTEEKRQVFEGKIQDRGSIDINDINPWGKR